VSANDRGIEHLDEMGRRAHCRERIEESFEDTGLAQPIEPFPDRIPVPEALRQCTPAHILHREEVHRLQEQPVVRSLASAPRQAGRNTISVCSQSFFVILVDIDPDLPYSRNPMNQNRFSLR